MEFLPDPIGWQFVAVSTQRKRLLPRPKNDGADCVVETRRTSGCDAGNIPLGMECGRIQDSFVTALQSGLWLFFFFCSRFLFIYVDLELFFCLSLVFVSNSGFVLRLLLVYSVVLGFVSHFNV